MKRLIYLCGNCGERFRSGEQDSVTCPMCGTPGAQAVEPAPSPFEQTDITATEVAVCFLGFLTSLIVALALLSSLSR